MPRIFVVFSRPVIIILSQLLNSIRKDSGMLYIVFAILLGVIVGFLFARCVFGTPNRSTETFRSMLKRSGLIGTPAIALPFIVCFALFEEAAHKELCLVAYFLSLLITAIASIVYTGWLVINSVIAGVVPPETIKSCRKRLLLAFCFRGYSAMEKEWQAIEDIIKKVGNNELTTENMSKEEKSLCDELKMTPQDLKQICDAAKRHLRD